MFELVSEQGNRPPDVIWGLLRATLNLQTMLLLSARGMGRTSWTLSCLRHGLRIYIGCGAACVLRANGLAIVVGCASVGDSVVR